MKYDRKICSDVSTLGNYKIFLSSWLMETTIVFEIFYEQAEFENLNSSKNFAISLCQKLCSQASENNVNTAESVGNIVVNTFRNDYINCSLKFFFAASNNSISLFLLHSQILKHVNCEVNDV